MTGRAVTAVAAGAATAWAGLVAARGGFWRTEPRLPEAAATPPPPVAVIALVPARNEAGLLPQTLPTLLAQDYPGPLRVVVVDDASTDGTAEVARGLGSAAERPVSVVTARPTPPGWAGKVWALAEGLRAADGGAEFVWLTDADIAHAPDVLRRLVSVADADGRDLVSVMALLRATATAERLTVPAFVYFFALLYPFRWVRAGRAAAAAGGCLLVRRSVLEGAGGFAALADALIDDVALARVVAGAGGRLWLGLSPDVRSVRAYGRLADVWEMVARSAYTQLRHDPLLLAGTTAGLLVLFAGPPWAVLAGRRGTRLAGLAAYLASAASYLPMVRYYGLPARWASTLPLAGALYAGMTLDSAWRYYRGQGPVGRWRR